MCVLRIGSFSGSVDKRRRCLHFMGWIVFFVGGREILRVHLIKITLVGDLSRSVLTDIISVIEGVSYRHYA